MDPAETLKDPPAKTAKIRRKKAKKPGQSRAERIKANEVAVRVGERVAFHRRERDWSQEELGSRLGISAESISRIEIGYTNISLARLSHLCDLLDISLVTVLQGTPASTHPNDEVQPLLTAMKDLSPKKRALVLKTAIDLAQLLHDD